MTNHKGGRYNPVLSVSAYKCCDDLSNLGVVLCLQLLQTRM